MATDTLSPIVAANVLALYEKSGDTLAGLSRATGISRGKLRDRLFGNFPWSIPEVSILAHHYDTTPEALFTAADEDADEVGAA